jgi:hypothetical protein
MAWLRTRNTAQDAATKHRGSTNAKHDANRTRLTAPCLHVACAALCDRRRRLARRLRNSETRTEWLDPKKAPSRGSPGAFSDLQGAFPKIRKLTGCPTRGGLFRIKSIGPQRKLESDFELPSRRRPTGQSRAPSRQGNDEVRLVGCCWRRVRLASCFAFVGPRCLVVAS